MCVVLSAIYGNSAVLRERRGSEVTQETRCILKLGFCITRARCESVYISTLPARVFICFGAGVSTFGVSQKQCISSERSLLTIVIHNAGEVMLNDYGE